MLQLGLCVLSRGERCKNSLEGFFFISYYSQKYQANRNLKSIFDHKFPLDGLPEFLLGLPTLFPDLSFYSLIGPQLDSLWCPPPGLGAHHWSSRVNKGIWRTRSTCPLYCCPGHSLIQHLDRFPTWKYWWYWYQFVNTVQAPQGSGFVQKESPVRRVVRNETNEEYKLRH